MSYWRIGETQRLTWICTGVALLLIVIHSVLQYATWVHQRTELATLTFWFNLDKEKNIPSAYAACSLVLCAVLLGYIAHAKRARRLPARHWWILAGIFVFLGLDEFVKIHERLTIPLRRALHVSGLLYYAWIIPYSVLTLTLCVSYGAFLWQLPRRIRWLFISAGSLFVGGAVGMEMLSGWYFTLHRVQDQTYVLLATIEEILEMSGVILFMYALLAYIHTVLPGGDRGAYNET
jgi:hypothetical protein